MKKFSEHFFVSNRSIFIQTSRIKPLSLMPKEIHLRKHKKSLGEYAVATSAMPSPHRETRREFCSLSGVTCQLRSNPRKGAPSQQKPSQCPHYHSQEESAILCPPVTQQAHNLHSLYCWENNRLTSTTEQHSNEAYDGSCRGIGAGVCDRSVHAAEDGTRTEPSFVHQGPDQRRSGVYRDLHRQQSANESSRPPAGFDLARPLHGHAHNKQHGRSEYAGVA